LVVNTWSRHVQEGLDKIKSAEVGDPNPSQAPLNPLHRRDGNTDSGCGAANTPIASEKLTNRMSVFGSRAADRLARFTVYRALA
jgi:hypothetical protein